MFVPHLVVIFKTVLGTDCICHQPNILHSRTLHFSSTKHTPLQHSPRMLEINQLFHELAEDVTNTKIMKFYWILDLLQRQLKNLGTRWRESTRSMVVPKLICLMSSTMLSSTKWWLSAVCCLSIPIFHGLLLLVILLLSVKYKWCCLLSSHFLSNVNVVAF